MPRGLRTFPSSKITISPVSANTPTGFPSYSRGTCQTGRQIPSRITVSSTMPPLELTDGQIGSARRYAKDASSQQPLRRFSLSQHARFSDDLRKVEESTQLGSSGR